jgi:Kef-type K+ transport system membrane component KefB
VTPDGGLKVNATELSFLPGWPLALGPLAWVAVLLLAALLAGEAVRRWIGISRVLGYLAVGAVLGPSALAVVDADTVSQLRVFADIAIGLLLFELGQRADLGWLRRNPMLLAKSVAEALLTFAAVFAVMTLAGLRPIAAAAAGVLAVATSPAVVMTVIKDLRAQGQVTERLTLLTALNTAYAVVGLALVFGVLHLDRAQPALTLMVLHPLYLIAGSALLAAVLAHGTLYLFGLFGRRPAFQFAITVGVVLVTVTLANALNLSVPLALLALGVFSRTFDSERHFVSLRFGESAMLFVVLLFALAGASLQFAGWLGAAPLALAFVVTRFVGKLAPVMLLARPSHLAPRKAWLLALAMTPMSGLALLMLGDLARASPQLAAEIGASLYLAISILAFAGPLALEYALRRGGEAAEDPR